MESGNLFEGALTKVGHAYADLGFLTTAVIVFFGTLAFFLLKGWWEHYRLRNIPNEKFDAGKMTLEELSKYSGRDPFLPILFSVQGRIFDVSEGRDFYGPGGGYALFAGKEVARALALMSLKGEDCSADIDDLTERQKETLKEWLAKFELKYPVVGEVIDPIELALEELKAYDGKDTGKPIYLAIKGTIFDVSKGRHFYGPDGIYPFAGRECARAFALLSTDKEDCNDNLDGLHEMDLENLQGWQAKFYAKYKIVGKVVHRE